MKFRVVGTLGDGSKFDKVVESPDQKTARSYAEQNGVTVHSVTPGPSPSLASDPASKSRWLKRMLHLTIAFPFLLIGFPVACNVAVIVLFIAVNGEEKLDQYSEYSRAGFSEYDISVPFFYPMCFVAFVYVLLMAIFGLIHLIQSSESQSTNQ